jgi:hypothetical protein
VVYRRIPEIRARIDEVRMGCRRAFRDVLAEAISDGIAQHAIGGSRHAHA